MKKIIVLLFLSSISFAQLPYTATKTITAGGSSYNYSVTFPDVYLSTAAHRATIIFDAVSISTNSSTITVYDQTFAATPANNLQNAGQISIMLNFQPAVIDTNTYTKPQ